MIPHYILIYGWCKNHSYDLIGVSVKSRSGYFFRYYVPEHTQAEFWISGNYHNHILSLHDKPTCITYVLCFNATGSEASSLIWTHAIEQYPPGCLMLQLQYIIGLDYLFVGQMQLEQQCKSQNNKGKGKERKLKEKCWYRMHVLIISDMK